MERKSLRLLLVLAVLMTAALACEGSFSTANISDAWMSTDLDGNNRTSIFAADAVFFAQVDLQNAPDDTSVKAVWIAVDVEDTEPNFVMNEFEYLGSDGLIYFQLENPDFLWPTGEYRVDLYLNDELDRSLTFYVQ
jgi:hypothetical protein